MPHAAAESAERAAVERRFIVALLLTFRTQGAIDAERRFAADVSAEVERRRGVVALRAQATVSARPTFSRTLKYGIHRGRVVLVPARIVVAVIEVARRLEPVGRRAEVEVEAGPARDRAPRARRSFPTGDCRPRAPGTSASNSDVIAQRRRPVDLRAVRRSAVSPRPTVLGDTTNGSERVRQRELRRLSASRAI